MTSFQTDANNAEILLSRNGGQIMMEWERPYMEASIDLLGPKGHVLEVGFGLGYSATQILKHNPMSYTVIECDPRVLEKARLWMDQHPTIPITIVEGRWQEKLPALGVFDEIYFDDYPNDLDGNSTAMQHSVSAKRFNIFLDLCIQHHTRVGSRICFYANGNQAPRFGSDSQPFVEYTTKSISTQIPENCEYRDLKEQMCTIPVITKTKEYDFAVAQRWAMEKIALFDPSAPPSDLDARVAVR
jgi:hypothetical protein